MSEQNERTTEEAETETTGENHSNEQSKSEASMLNSQMETAMLEDEEMPTYISVSSPSKREDSDVINSKQQDRIAVEEDHSRSSYPSDDQGGGSVYVLSSGEGSDHPPYNEEEEEEEEEDEYGDSEDMDEMDLENDHENPILEDEEDDELRNMVDYARYRDHSPEYFATASDDSIVALTAKVRERERRLSLRDLSICKNNIRSPYHKKRYSLNTLRQNYLGLRQNPVIYPVTHRKQSMPLRYRHVESKVKRYIKDIKEQNRRSMEKRIKGQECTTNKNHMDNENNDNDPLKPVLIHKTIKDYAEKAIKDLQREENSADGNSVYDAQHIMKNGESNKIYIKQTENQSKNVRRDSETDVHCESAQSEKNIQSSDDRLEKRNGSVNVSASHAQYQGSLDQSSFVNGHQQQAPTLFNLRSLSYEEYMHGTSNAGPKGDLTKETHAIQEENNECEGYNEAETMNVPETENSNTDCPLKIENVKSILMTLDEPENSNFIKTNQADKVHSNNVEVAQLKSQLSQKNAQFNSLRDAYQKTLAENLKMKEKLDALKRSLAKYESENKPCETKVASVQTEAIVESVLNKKTSTDVKETNNKISTSSVGSTISSIDQWADSACSPAISIKPPDVTTILNSDDSMVITDSTPRKSARSLSKTFITSSRILQTLSNITQGKTKSESSLAQNVTSKLNENSTEQFLHTNYNSPIQASSSKKRKATDMLGTSTFAQPFKIPHTNMQAEKKNNVPSDVEFKYPEQHTSFKSKEQQNSGIADTDRSESPTDLEQKVQETDDHEESVKCFVYQEDENSKNKSFLIQAEEPTKEMSTEKGRVQECGPYLLGNLEVRMSEINGTISVWGKEVSQESMIANEDEIVEKPNENKSCSYWQKTPQTRFNGSSVACSSNKKSKIPVKFSESNVPQCLHLSPLNVVKGHFSMDGTINKRHMSSPFSPNTCFSPFENSDPVKHRKNWSTCNRISSSQDKIHSCCMHHVESSNKECICGVYQEKQRRDDSLNRSKDKFNIKGLRRSLCKNTPDSKRHLHENIANSTADISETARKYNTTCQCSLQNTVQNSKCYNAIRDISCMYKSPSANTSRQENTDRHTCNHSPLNDDDEDPLIPHKRSNETPETRQRRLSGKKVRGILMDLLRGCGDCRNPNTANSKGLREKEIPYLTNGPPQIKISPCPTPEASCSNSTQCNERCCHAYARRIESQLEEFRMEMERVRSRSDAILDMLSMLHSVDMN